MTCKKCGAEVENDRATCWRCGAAPSGETASKPKTSAVDFKGHFNELWQSFVRSPMMIAAIILSVVSIFYNIGTVIGTGLMLWFTVPSGLLAIGLLMLCVQADPEKSAAFLFIRIGLFVFMAATGRLIVEIGGAAFGLSAEANAEQEQERSAALDLLGKICCVAGVVTAGFCVNMFATLKRIQEAMNSRSPYNDKIQLPIVLAFLTGAVVAGTGVYIIMNSNLFNLAMPCFIIAATIMVFGIILLQYNRMIKDIREGYDFFHKKEDNQKTGSIFHNRTSY